MLIKLTYQTLTILFVFVPGTSWEENKTTWRPVGRREATNATRTYGCDEVAEQTDKGENFIFICITKPLFQLAVTQLSTVGM